MGSGLILVTVPRFLVLVGSLGSYIIHKNCKITFFLSHNELLIAVGCKLCKQCADQCVGVASHGNNKWQIVRLDYGKGMATIETLHSPIKAQQLVCSKYNLRVIDNFLGRAVIG